METISVAPLMEINKQNNKFIVISDTDIRVFIWFYLDKNILNILRQTTLEHKEKVWKPEMRTTTTTTTKRRNHWWTSLRLHCTKFWMARSRWFWVRILPGDECISEFHSVVLFCYSDGSSLDTKFSSKELRILFL